MRILLLIFLLLISSCSVIKNAEELQFFASQKESKKVIIKQGIDMQGKSLEFPHGCKIVFKGGYISNADLSFDSVSIKGSPRFINCKYSGSILINTIDDRDFTSGDDMGTFKFLMSNAILNGTKCDFYRDYRLDINQSSRSGLIFIRDLNSGAAITFHNCIIYNTTAFNTSEIKPVIVLQNVKNVEIRNCFFHDTDDHNARLFRRSAGCNFIRCYGDCDGINILDCKQENGDCFLRSGVFAHDSNLPDRTPILGLTNSILKIESINAGYGLAINCGSNLDINILTLCPHRGFYCAGVSSSTIKYKGYNPIETKCHILVKDAVYRTTGNRGQKLLDLRGCSNLKIYAIIDEIMPNESAIDFSSYGSGKNDGADFTFRSNKCHHNNIDYSVDILKAPESGYYFISRFLSYGGDLEEGEKYGCKVSGIKLHDVHCYNGKSRPYMCKISPGIEADIMVADCTVSDYNTEKGYGFDYYISGNSTGRILISNTLTGNVLVRDKNRGEFNVEVEGIPITRSLNYVNDNSSRGLVRLKQRTE